jgi:hypothetical protein
MDDRDFSKKNDASVVTKKNVPKRRPPNKRGRIIIRNLSFKVSLEVFLNVTCLYVWIP